MNGKTTEPKRTWRQGPQKEDEAVSWKIRQCLGRYGSVVEDKTVSWKVRKVRQCLGR